MIDLAKVKTLSAHPAKDALNVFDAANWGLPDFPGYAAPAVAGPSCLPDTPGRADMVEASGPLTMTRGTMMRMRKAGLTSRRGMTGQEQQLSWASSELLAAPPA